MLKVLIVDDHAVVREGLKRVLERGDGDFEVAEAGDGVTALELTRRQPFDAILLDVEMPGLSGLDVLKQLLREQPRARVLALSVLPEDEAGLRMLKAGALGYLCKDRTREELADAVAAVAAGERYVTPSLAELLADRLAGAPGPTPHAALTDREYLILRALAQGRTITEIARDMCLSAKTVSTYHTQILKKLALDSDADLQRYCLEHGLAG